MAKKRHFKYFQQPSTDARQGLQSSSSSPSTRQDGGSKLLEASTAEASPSISRVNEQLQLLRESSRARPTRAAIEEFVHASTAPSRPPEMASSLNAHNYGNERLTSNYDRMMLRTMRCYQNGQEIVFVNMARRGQAGRWVRVSNPNETRTGPRVSFSGNPRVEFRLHNGSRRKKGFTRLSRDTSGASALPRPGSLLDLSLRTMAQNWMFVKEYEIHNLDILPCHLGSKLLSYLGIYAPSGTVNLETLKLLVKKEDMESTRMLDLTGCVSHRLSVKDVLTFLKNGASQVVASDSTQQSKCESGEASEYQSLEAIEDLSWDQQLNLMSHGVSLPLISMSGLSIASPFENLTHLSLAHPSPGSRPWYHLFRMTKAPLALTRLTHFSLAYWPSPFVDSERTEPTSASGYQDDSILQPQQLLLARMAYKATLASNGAWLGLKKFAKFTPRLEELDLEGCAHWALCLAERRRTWAESAPPVTGRFDLLRDAVGSNTRVLDETPFFMAHWDDLRVVHLGQGSMPATTDSERIISESSMRTKLARYLDDRMKILENHDHDQHGGTFDHDFDEFPYPVIVTSPDVGTSFNEWQPELHYMNEIETDHWLDKEERIESAARQLIKGSNRDGTFRKGILVTGTFPKRI